MVILPPLEIEMRKMGRSISLPTTWTAFLPYYVLIDYGLSGIWKEDFMLTSLVFLTVTSAFAAGMSR